MDPGAEVKDANWEKELPGGGVGVTTGPLALLFWVTDESSGPPGISETVSVVAPEEDWQDALVLAPNPSEMPPPCPKLPSPPNDNPRRSFSKLLLDAACCPAELEPLVSASASRSISDSSLEIGRAHV